MNPTTWHQVITQDIDQVVDNPHVRLLVQHWQQAHDNGRRVCLDAFEPVRWPQIAGSLMLLRQEAREGGADFRVRHHGAEIAALSPCDATGQTLRQLGGEMAGFLLPTCLDTLAGQRPRYTVHLTGPDEAVSTWEQLLLPLVDGQDHPWLLVYRRALEWRHQRAGAVLEATSAAMLGLRAVTDARGVVLDWLVLMANPALGRLFGVDAGALVGKTVAAALPHWQELELTADCVAAMRFGNPREIERLIGNDDGELHEIAVHIGPLPDGVVLTLADLTRWLQPRQGTPRLIGTDALTGLADRHEFDERLRGEVLYARRAADGLSLVMAELEMAEPDRSGAPARACDPRRTDDDPVRRLARLLAGACERERDLVAHLGAGTFALLLPATDLQGTSEVVARVRRSLDPLGSSPLSLSLGVACFLRDGHDRDLFRRAEQALSEARQAGGHRVVIDPESLGPGVSGCDEVRPLPMGHGPMPGMEMRDVELPELALREAGLVAGRVMRSSLSGTPWRPR